jgi:transglutaminase-like putative cysteine protease
VRVGQFLFVSAALAAALPGGPGNASDPPAVDADTVQAAATRLIDRLAAGEFTAALEVYDRPPGAKVSAETLRAEWQAVIRRAGPLRARAAGDVRVRGTGVIATVQCTFAEAALDAVLFCTPAGKAERLTFIPPPLGGPGLIRAGMAEVVKAAEPGAAGTVTFPVPGPYRDQLPLAFRVAADPPAALTAARLVRRDDGVNWLCEVAVAPPGDKALVRWEALVLVGGKAAAALPPAPKPEAPVGAAPWVRATGCVQSDDPDIRAKAEELTRGAADVAEYARRVIRFTTMNPLRWELCRTLSASDALRGGSSCTGRAHLAAALLRARGIPARTVAHLPTWSGPLFCHWLVEYWHPGAGWVWLEPTLDQPQPPAWTAVVVNVANPADEDDAYNWTRASGVAAGVARRAARELAGGLRPSFDPADRERWGAVNLATPEVALRGTEAELCDLFAAARASFGEWSAPGVAPPTDAGRIDRLLAAARGGDAARLARAVRQP